MVEERIRPAALPATLRMISDKTSSRGWKSFCQTLLHPIRIRFLTQRRGDAEAGSSFHTEETKATEGEEVRENLTADYADEHG